MLGLQLLLWLLPQLVVKIKRIEILGGKVGEKVMLSIIWWMRKNTQNKRENDKVKVFFTGAHQIGGENLTKIEWLCQNDLIVLLHYLFIFIFYPPTIILVLSQSSFLFVNLYKL